MVGRISSLADKRKANGTGGRAKGISRRDSSHYASPAQSPAGTAAVPPPVPVAGVLDRREARFALLCCSRRAFLGGGLLGVRAGRLLRSSPDGATRGGRRRPPQRSLFSRRPCARLRAVGDA